MHSTDAVTNGFMTDAPSDQSRRRNESAPPRRRGDQEALRRFSRYRDRLKRMVSLRLSRRLAGRVDDSDGSRYLRAIKRLREILERIPGFDQF